MPGIATRPALEIEAFFIVLACTEVEAKFPNMRIDVIDSAKIVEDFARNILGAFRFLFSLGLGICNKENARISFSIQGY